MVNTLEILLFALFQTPLDANLTTLAVLAIHLTSSINMVLFFFKWLNGAQAATMQESNKEMLSLSVCEESPSSRLFHF